MHPRPKYKVGDLLEYWTKHEHFYYLVVGHFLERCGNPKCRNCPTRIDSYSLKNMETGEIEGWSINTVDMLGWGGLRRLCRAGWRRVA